MRKIFVAVLIAATFGICSTAAEARDGCGIGWHRGFLGGCYRNEVVPPVVVAPAPVVVAPVTATTVAPATTTTVVPATTTTVAPATTTTTTVVPAGTVVVQPAVVTCPAGYHLGPYGHHCFAN